MLPCIPSAKSASYCRAYLPSSLPYHFSQVIDHYENPRNVGSFDKNDTRVGTGLVGAPACGDVMKLQVIAMKIHVHLYHFVIAFFRPLFLSLQIKVDEDGKIVDARFKTFGCGSAIASSSLATEWVKGKSVRKREERERESKYINLLLFLTLFSSLILFLSLY